MAESLVSVVIPLFNKDKYIANTLISLAKQSYKNWECIIVDDGSMDNSLSLVREFFSSFNYKHKIIVGENRGQSCARNLGIDACSGDYVAFLDGDDLWHPSKIQIQVDFLNSNRDLDIVLGGYVVLENSRPPRAVSHNDYLKLKRGWLSFNGFGGALESVAMVRRIVLFEHKFDERLSTSAGLDLFLRISQAGRVGFLPNILMGYLKYPGQWHRGFSTLATDTRSLGNKLTDTKDARLLLQGLTQYRNMIEMKMALKPFSLSKLTMLLFSRQLPNPKFLYFFALRQLKSLILAKFYRLEISEIRKCLRP